MLSIEEINSFIESEIVKINEEQNVMLIEAESRAKNGLIPLKSLPISYHIGTGKLMSLTRLQRLIQGKPIEVDSSATIDI